MSAVVDTIETGMPVTASPSDRRSFFALMATSFMAIGGNAFTMLAIPLYVLATTGSAAKTGIVAFVNTAPPIVSAILGGAAIDRIGRKRILMISDALSMVTLGCIPLFAILDIVTYPLLLVLVALGSFLDAPGSTARQSMLPSLATRAGLSPERAQSFFSVSFGLAQIIGPSLAGICVAAIGPAGTIWINAGTFALSIIVVGLFITAPRDSQASIKSDYLEDLRVGFRYVWHDSFLRGILMVSAGFSLLFIPIYTILYPVYFTRVVHSAKGLGFFIGAESLGALIGAIVYGVIGERMSRYKAMAFCLIAWLPAFWVMVLHPPLWVLLIAGFIGGLLTGPLQTIFNVAFQVRTPEAMRPRIYGIAMASSLIAVPLGALVMGPLIEIAGIMPALTILAAIITIYCIVSAFLPMMRELDHPLEQEIPAQTPS